MLKTSHGKVQTRPLFEDAKILGSHIETESMTWCLRLADSLNNEAETAITKLANNSILPNVFYELPILKAATSHFKNRKIQYLVLTKQSKEKETLKFFMPVTLSPIGIFRHKVLLSWTHDYAPVGMPLISSKNDDEALSGFIECLKGSSHHTAKAIVIQMLSKEGNFINGLYESKALSEKLLLAAGMTRAGLKPTKNQDYIGTHFSGKRKQRLRKATNELKELGELLFTKSFESETIEQSLNDFLALEEKGWKGKGKTALKNSADSEAFCRNAVYNMAVQKRCHIHSLKLNEVTIASLISFEKNGYFYPWKITYDEAYAKHSVGNLLAVHATSEFAADKNFKGLDSLAAEYNETALRFWPDEKEFFSMVIGLGQNATATTLKITNELNRLKRILKTLRTLFRT